MDRIRVRVLRALAAVELEPRVGRRGVERRGVAVQQLLPLPLHVCADPRLGPQLEHLVSVGLRVRA